LFSYEDRLTKFDLNILELRRLHNDCVMCYKLVFGLIDVNFTDFFTFSPSGVTIEVINLKLNCIKQELREQGTLSSLIWSDKRLDTVYFTSLCIFKHTTKLAELLPFLKASMS